LISFISDIPSFFPETFTTFTSYIVHIILGTKNVTKNAKTKGTKGT